MNSKEKWKRRQEGVDLARGRGFKLRSIATAIGTKGSNLGHILRRESEHSPFVPALDDWLEANIWAKAAPPVPADSDPRLVRITEVLALLSTTLLDESHPLHARIHLTEAYLDKLRADLDTLAQAVPPRL